MRQRNDHSDEAPRREELAAYFDGELSGRRRQLLEAWLADHPEAQADLEEWRQLRRDWQTTRATEPSASTWAGVQERIVVAAVPPRARRWRMVLTAAAGLAAAFLLAWFLHRPTSNDEPLVVASAGDIEIISMEAADASALVVGHPMSEPLVLADSADINVENIEPDGDGAMPSVRWWTGAEAPMIVATLTPEPPEDER